jgi:putative FmdB family regulatory protein
MPTYEYECSQCQHHFDKKQSFHDKPGALCPKCQGESRRVMVPAPIVFKGTGFYVTDYRGKAPNDAPPPTPKPGTNSSPGAGAAANPSPIPSPSASSS